MNLIFGILAHDDAPMLCRLVQALSDHKIIIHLDAKVDLDEYLQSFPALLAPNVAFVRNRKTVYWGGFSVVEAMMSFAEEIQTRDSNSSLVFLSGHCYPLQPLELLKQHLEISRGVACRAYAISSDSGAEIRAKVMRRHWFDFAGSMRRYLPPSVVRIVRKTMSLIGLVWTVQPQERTYVGSQWIALPVDRYMEAVESIRSGRFNYLKNGFAPDEMVFHTFVHNSRWMSATQSEVDEPSKMSELANLHHLIPSMAGFFSAHDMEELEASSSFFVRKVQSRDAHVVEYLERLYRERSEMRSKYPKGC